MAPHLSDAELALLRAWLTEGRRPSSIWQLLRERRLSAGVQPLGLTAVRKALKGKTHKKSGVETRGRKRKLSARAVRAIDAKRKELISKAGGRREVTWPEVLRKARVKPVHSTTARRALSAAGIPVAARAPRQKPQRAAAHLEERTSVCRRWRFLPRDYFSQKVDLIIDNKYWPVPMTPEARAHLQQFKVRFHLRTRADGLTPGFTKPNAKRHKRNPGASVLVCAGIHRDRVALWKYIEGPWGGVAAADLYKHDVKRVLDRVAGSAVGATIIEDNDPAGYKSARAVAATREVGIRVLSLPRYSPDLNPLDYFLWADIQRRMDMTAPRGRETADAFKRRLRATAFATPRRSVRKAVAQMKDRAAAIYAAGGENIAWD